ncbi:MAG: nicotinamide riboside transporter PnuC [Chitinophagales bacterium]|nr:nicotinamide riboside transporter PnuC [Chitinophagales bacterium]
MEGIVTLFSFLGTLFAIYHYKSSWMLFLVASLLSIYLFYQTSLIANMMLQIYVSIRCVQGFLYWEKLSVNQINVVQYGLLTTIGLFFASIVLITIIFGIYNRLISIKVISNSLSQLNLLLDSSVLVFTVFANELLLKKQANNWIFWMVVNTLSTILYFVESLYFLSFLYLIFLFMAFYGFFHWKRIGFQTTNHYS